MYKIKNRGNEMALDDTVLLREKRGPVEWVTLNRPESLNAMNPDLVTALRRYFEGKYEDHETRIIVLKANGGNFCAGLDLKQQPPADLGNIFGRHCGAAQTLRKVICYEGRAPVDGADMNSGEIKP